MVHGAGGKRDLAGMAGIALRGGRNVGRGFAQRRTAVVAGGTGADRAGVVLELGRLEGNEVGVTDVAGLRGRNMAGRLADGLHAMAGRTRTGGRGVVREMRIDLVEGHCSRMADIAARVGQWMAGRLGKGTATAALIDIGAVVAGRTLTGHGGCVTHQRRRPLVLVVAIAACLGTGGNVIRHLRGGAAHATLRMAVVAITRDALGRATAMAITTFQAGVHAVQHESRGVMVEVRGALRVGR